MTTESLSVTIEGELLTVEIGTVAATAGGGGGSAAWGDITGTLSAQTDLSAALALKAPLASPTLTGTPAAPTAAGATSTTQIATTAFVGGEITTHAGATDPHGDRSFATSAVSTHSALTTGAHGLGGASQLNVGTTAGTVAAGDHAHSGVYQPLATVLTNTTAAFTTAQETKLAGIETAADVTDAGNVGAAIDGATAKTTPVDADTVPLIDSAAGNVLKKLSWANIKATAKTYFDTLYQAASATLTTWAGITPGTGVATAIGTNVGTAGSVVTNGGALGTPSSGNLANCTGYPGGSGDVAGPASSTDNAVARFDSTTGKLLQNTTNVTIADTGALAITPDANAKALTIASHTHTASNPAVDVAQTWNNAAVAFDCWKVNITSTASAATSHFATFQVGGSTVLAFQKNATIKMNGTWIYSSGSGALKVGNGQDSSADGSFAAGRFVTGGNTIAIDDLGFAGLGLAATRKIFWSSTGAWSGSADSGLSRSAAGVVEVNSGTIGTFRDLKLCNLLAAGGNGSYVQTPSMTVANLAAAATAGSGARAFVTDATATTYLSTVAGGGSNKVPVVSDGTNWLIG